MTKCDDLHPYFSLTRIHGEYLILGFLARVSITNKGVETDVCKISRNDAKHITNPTNNSQVHINGP